MTTKLLLIAIAYTTLWSCGENSSSDDQFANREQAELEERIATVINLNGHLCAKVVWIGPVLESGEYAGEYQVTCDEYRDPEKASTEHNMVVYMVNPDTKMVRVMKTSR